MALFTEKPDDVTGLSAAQLAQLIKSKQVSALEVSEAFLANIAATDDEIAAFLYVNAATTRAQAQEIDKRIAAGDELPSALAGVPIALKDVFTTVDAPTTCGSKMLVGWFSPYDATVTKKLRQAGMPILGKTNMDEFAMGSSTENSAFKVTKNPWDITKIPGGSGGGSAAAVAAYQTPLAVGTDTGGSIRQPAALTATVGVKPTYGAVSRYGLVACASSLDQAGPCGRNLLDTALLHSVIAGHDPLDSTSLTNPLPDVVAAVKLGERADLSGTKIGIISELTGTGIAADVVANFEAAVKVLSNLGAEIVEISCPNFQYAISAYYIIMPSEVSSNLARFDAMRYGNRYSDTNANNAAAVMAASRDNGFGAEVKRRIIIGTYALSAGYYDEYYGKALQVRTLIQQDFIQAFHKVDALISPTTPSTAFGVGEKINDPLQMYLFDLCTLPVNLAGNCAISVPSGFSTTTNLPCGLQIIAPALRDDLLYLVGAAYETARGN